MFDPNRYKEVVKVADKRGRIIGVHGRLRVSQKLKVAGMRRAARQRLVEQHFRCRRRWSSLWHSGAFDWYGKGLSLAAGLCSRFERTSYRQSHRVIDHGETIGGGGNFVDLQADAAQTA